MYTSMPATPQRTNGQYFFDAIHIMKKVMPKMIIAVDRFVAATTMPGAMPTSATFHQVRPLLIWYP